LGRQNFVSQSVFHRPKQARLSAGDLTTPHRRLERTYSWVPQLFVGDEIG
jgi:hypothetical protein